MLGLRGMIYRTDPVQERFELKRNYWSGSMEINAKLIPVAF